MEVDHLFIFSDNKGREAEDLINFGLVEGSSRRHPGQGTTNRKFYFDNFFLEVLWVVDQEEINQSPTKETGLWERANFKTNGYARFGLCLVNTASTDQLFENSQLYQPNYFPPGMSIDIIPNHKHNQLPWTFRLPYRGGQKPKDEPRTHKNGIRKLTKIEFGILDLAPNKGFLDFFNQEKLITFKKEKELKTRLEFDNGQQGKSLEIKALDLLIKY